MVTVTAPRAREETRPTAGPATGSAPGPGPAPAGGVGPLAVLGLFLASAAGGVVIAPGYAVPANVYAVVVSSALLGVVATLLLRRRVSASLALLAGLPLPLAAVAACALWLPGEGTGVWRSAGEAILHSGARILTSTAPTPANVDTLALPLLATWLTAAASALAWCGRRRALALLPGLLLLVGAAVLNGPVAPPGFLAIGMLTVAAAVVMSAPRSEAGRGAASDPAGLTIEVDTPGETSPARWTRAVATGALATLTAAAAVFAGPLLLAGWDAEPEDPREALTPPMRPRRRSTRSATSPGGPPTPTNRCSRSPPTTPSASGGPLCPTSPAPPGCPRRATAPRARRCPSRCRRCRTPPRGVWRSPWGRTCRAVGRRSSASPGASTCRHRDTTRSRARW
ncbi:hypothetical protein [Nocardiopsis sp. CNR-923]|uniref:hypothetical protein n=1 Tax=Nocardiopsis sp. CNR-923 TaxID=1904965 RepID=UPI0021CCC4F7|nr:hypothetical protein [Nocardiopsis sp. CNR-923]